MADGKWIDDLEPDKSTAEAARHVLKVRLAGLHHLLLLALREAEHDAEHVHRLRVATRRADAALRIFRTLLPEKVFQQARKSLRSVRRAAGAARDWDVFFLELVARRSERPSAEHAGLDFLAGYASGQRAAAQAVLQEAGRKAGDRFDAFPGSVVNSVERHGDGATLLEHARPLLSLLSQRLLTAAERDLTDFGNLHQVRIAGKRLRYAMEVFGNCFPPTFRESVYPSVEEMQNILGWANDSHVAIGLLNRLRDRLKLSAGTEWKYVRPGVESMLRHHRSGLTRDRRDFLAWRKRWIRTGRTELTELLRAAAEADLR